MGESEKQNESFWLPLFVVVVGAFAAILNTSSVNIALPKMMAIFGVAADQIQWVLTAYMLTSAVMPITTAGMNTIPPQEVGRASALNNVCRQVAGTFWIAVLTTTMQSRQTFHFAQLADSVSMSSPVMKIQPPPVNAFKS